MGITLGENMKKRYPRQFEIPYNFDKGLIDALVALNIGGQDSYSTRDYGIFSIYVAPYIGDDEATVRDTNIIKHISYDEYVSHLEYINKYFPGDIQILFNGIGTNVKEEVVLKYYREFNVRKFCVNNDEDAKLIRKLIPDADITASITMCLTEEQINNLDKELYDNIVLFFPFNQNFNAIKRLPEHFNYILLANSYCDANCDGIHHWKLSEEEQCTQDIPCPHYGDNHVPVMIRPQDLPYFDDYIFAYKLQDRSWSTMHILTYFCMACCSHYFTEMPGIEPYNESFYNRGDIDGNT